MDLKCAYFTSASALTAFTNDPLNGVSGVVSITFDAASNQFALFYTAV